MENVATQEIHTLGRYPKGAEVLNNYRTHVSGVHMDMELMLEEEVRKGRYILLSVYVRNPVIFLGPNNGYGYTICNGNCASYSRAAWKFYSGEEFSLPWLDMPEDLAYFIWKKYPQLPFAKRLGYCE